MSRPAEIADTLKVAAGLVAGLPEHLQPTAFAEAVRLLTLSPSSKLGPPAGSPTPDDVESLPSPALVKQRGSRLQKVLFSVASLTAEGQSATSVAIEKFLRERLASPVPKVTDVLRSGVPEYLMRTKDGSLFEYHCTDDGLAQLRSLHQLREP